MAMRAGSSREDALAPVQLGPKVGEERKEAEHSSLSPMNHWVDRETGHNCFMLSARGLSITWGVDTRYWHWLLQKETSAEIEVASLWEVCWLEIHGKLEISYLTPGITYEIAFIVKMNERASGWNNPVILRFKLPDGSVQEHMECLKEKPRGKWVELKVGELRTQAGHDGMMDIGLWGTEAKYWKKGLVVRGIVIRPKKL